VVVTAVIIDCSFVVGEGGRGGGEIKQINQFLILR
jgi:hypothetical protein